MTKYLIIIICSLIQYSPMASQASQGKIKGKISDSNSASIMYATISVQDTANQLIQGVISDEDGNFMIENVPFGDYTIMISYIGYQDLEQKIQVTSSKLIKLGTLTMIEDAQALDEVVIRAEKSQYELRMDKRVFNVGKDVVAQGGTALDILNQVPQVTVDPSGTIALRGSSAVQVMINGRRSGLSMSEVLDQIDIENINKIEVITNPSARFDASGSAGIINIVLKKDKGEGLKGQVRLTTGAPANHILMPSLSYKSKKINLFGNYRYRYSDYDGQYTSDQRNIGDAAFSRLTKNEIEDRHDDGRSFYVGGDYYINDKSSLTMAFFRYDTDDTDRTSLSYVLTNESAVNKILRSGSSGEQRHYNQLETNFETNFGEGKKLDLNLQYDYWNSDKSWQLITTGNEFLSNTPYQLRTVNGMSSNDIVLDGNLAWPILSGNVTTGLKMENRNIQNDFLAQSNDNNEWITYQGIDNEVAYGEMIIAGYAEYSNQYKKWQANAGMRVEKSMIELDDSEGLFTNEKNYTKFFPSAFISYRFSDVVQLQSGYSRRIRRPSLWSLYPFSELTDINVVNNGNPDLDPRYTDSYEITASVRRGKISLNPGIYHRRNHQAFETFIQQNDDGFFNTLPVNIDQLNETGVELNARYAPASFLSLNLDFNYLQFDQNGSYQGIDMSASGSSWSSRLNTNVDLPYDIQWRSAFTYFAARNNALVTYKPSSDLSMSVSKSFFDNKFEVSARVSNILDTRREITITETEDYVINQNDSRNAVRYGLNFTYKFNYAPRDRMRMQNNGNR